MNTCQTCGHMLAVWEAVQKGVLSEDVKKLRERGDAATNPVSANGGRRMAIGSTDAYCPLNNYLVTFDHSCSRFQRA